MPPGSTDTLFDTTGPEHIQLDDAELFWMPAFLTPQESQSIFLQLREETLWQQDQIRMHGRVLPVPRLQAWYGHDNSNYGYSGIALKPHAFTPLLSSLKKRLEKTSGWTFNSVLLNYYRNGNDSVSWHSDDEKELGKEPLIASLSLGCGRRFELRHKTRRDLQKLKIELTDGSLLLMGKGLQQNWLHQIPKQAAVASERINLTFRFIH